MISNFKKFLPKKILPRLLIIFFVPLICIQFLAVFLFYDRHWEKITTRFANITSNQVNLIISDYQKNGSINKKLAASLNIQVQNKNNKNDTSIKSNTTFIQRNIINILRNRIKQEHKIFFLKEKVRIDVSLNDKIFQILVPRKYLISETPIILFLWIITSSVILTLIAFLFLRIQVRAITRLSEFSDNFGIIGKTKKFKPEGAVEIRRAGNALIKMKKRIQNQINNQTFFLAGISHDLGTIITRLKLQIELATKASDLNEIRNDINSMQILLNEYLEYSKNVDTKEKINLINIKKFLENIIFDSKKYFQNINISLNCRTNINIKINENNLYRVLSNILNNACKFGSKINIFVKKEEKKITINLHDNGPGIPKEMKKKVFTPFFKLDTSRNLNEPGSGLGLSIAQEVISKMGGKIKVSDSDLGGSCFSIILLIR